MIKQLHMVRNKTLQTAIVLLLTLGITGLGGASGGQLFCEPACPMHQSGKLPPSCCDQAAAEQMQMASVPAAADEPHQSADPFCDGKLCVDSSRETRDTAIFGQAVNAFTVLHSTWLLPDLPAVEPSSRKLSFNFFQIHTGPPIYKRTCSYLI